MTIRKDVYVYNESRGLVATGKLPGRGRSKKSKIPAWDQLVSAHSVLAVELAQDDPFVVRVVVNGELTAEESAEWVDKVTAKLHLSADGLALCGGTDYGDDPGDEDNECVELVDVPSATYTAELYTYFTSPNYVITKSPWPKAPELADRRYVDFLLRLTPWTDGVVCTPTDAKGWIPWKQPPRRPETAPRGIVAVKPQGWSPHREADEHIPPPGRAKIRMIAMPPGDAPEWVRRAWVGLELPLVPDAPDKKDLVYTHEAIAVLAAADAKAAGWWRANFPRACKANGMTFAFAPKTYERIV